VRALIGTGESYEARATMGTRMRVAVEVAYVGSYQSNLHVAGLPDNAYLLSNGAETDMRLNLTKRRIQPYAFGGVGWVNYRVHNNGSVSDLSGSDNALTVPFGVGVSWRVRSRLLVDVRGTGRVLYGDSLLSRAVAQNGSGDSSMHSWNASARLGWEF
jgi:opacity protein-like surface antigen